MAEMHELHNEFTSNTVTAMINMVATNGGGIDDVLIMLAIINAGCIHVACRDFTTNTITDVAETAILNILTEEIQIRLGEIRDKAGQRKNR